VHHQRHLTAGITELITEQARTSLVKPNGVSAVVTRVVHTYTICVLNNHIPIVALFEGRLQAAVAPVSFLELLDLS
jgi:hypothetical protein